jgi:hypothetical protein
MMGESFPGVVFKLFSLPLKVPYRFFNIGQGIIFATCSGDIFQGTGEMMVLQQPPILDDRNGFELTSFDV